MKKLNIGLVNVLNQEKKTAMNKELNGGYGTCDEYGNALSSKLIKLVKKKSIRLPPMSFAFLQAIFKDQGHNVECFEGTLPSKPLDLILIYGSIVDYKNETTTGKKLKEKFPETKIGFVGPFPSTKPELFDTGDFVIIGEAESFFMEDFKEIKQLKGNVQTTNPTDMDKLPTPNFDGFPIEEYSYNPAIPDKPFLVLQASKGCPYSCGFYCTYGAYQGPRVRQRSAKKVVDDIVSLQEKHKVKGIQFRDPIFGLNKEFTNDFCNELKSRNVKIKWGMETRLDLLNEENVQQMYDVGLRNINVGIETKDTEVAKRNKRILVTYEHQEKMVKFCNKLGINISAFYIIGLDGDTEKTVNETIKYSIELNTLLARFAVSTPYPGTKFYNQLEEEGRLLTKDYEKYTQFSLVYKHEHFSQERVQQLVQQAMRRYYFRPSYASKILKSKLKN